MISRLVEPLLRPFDSEERELVLRWRVWKMRWLPYRTAELIDFDDESDLLLGPWKWHLPDRLGKRFR